MRTDTRWVAATCVNDGGLLSTPVNNKLKPRFAWTFLFVRANCQPHWTGEILSHLNWRGVNLNFVELPCRSARLALRLLSFNPIYPHGAYKDSSGGPARDVREAIRVQLEGEPDFAVVGEASDAAAATELIKKLSPNIVILDIELRGTLSFDFPRLFRHFPATRVVVLSALCDKRHIIAALQDRASGYVFKHSSYNILAEAIRTVATGGIYVPISLSKLDLKACIKRKSAGAAAQSTNLTLRQREVLDLAAAGFTNSEIASRLSISRRTVEAHRSRLMHKLALNDRAGLIRYAYKMREAQVSGTSPEISRAKI